MAIGRERGRGETRALVAETITDLVNRYGRSTGKAILAILLVVVVVQFSTTIIGGLASDTPSPIVLALRIVLALVLVIAGVVYGFRER